MALRYQLQFLKIMSNLNEPFDPRKTTLKDYLIFLVEESKDNKEKLEKLSEKVNMLESDMKTRNALIAEKDKQRKGLLAIVGIVGSVIGFLVDLLIRVFSE